MDADAIIGPDDDLPDLWVVPLQEPSPEYLPKPDPLPYDGPPILSLFEPDDPPSDVGFHPHLRRFDEAA